MKVSKFACLCKRRVSAMFKKLSVLTILQLVSVFIFCAGFFPQKNVLNGDAHFEIERDLQLRSKPVFKKLVVIVIDALRSDFLYDDSISKFHFVHSKLNSGEAWGFTAYSSPPTVTLPRLKGITTGSTPNFLDAILNVAEDDTSSNVKDQDSWPRQFHENGYRLRFFGDDTWLKLFPSTIFDEYEGTNSFFVSDFEQVDLNVTRHLDKQLNEKKEWDVLILHYLGLDHIGHKFGPFSQFMPAKHREMDNVIKKLYNDLDDDTLMVIMGDHGMNNVGNHGGSSAGETHAGLVFMSKKLPRYDLPERQKGVQLPIKQKDGEENDYEYLSAIQQMDLVPTFATLFNVPVPKNSVGIIIPDFLQLLDKKMGNIKLRENYRQLAELSNGYPSTLDYHTDMTVMLETMRDIQDDLIHSATNYNYQLIAVGFSLCLFVTVLCSWLVWKELGLSVTCVYILSITLLIGFSTFGSSFVEEEHQLWWWVITASIFCSYLYCGSFWSHFIIFASLRVIRGWNNTGQKTTYDYVISNLLHENFKLEWYLNILTVVLITVIDSSLNAFSFVTTFTLGMVVLTYKVTWAVVNQESVPAFMINIAWKFCPMFTDSSENILQESLIPMAQFFYQCFACLVATKIILTRLGIHEQDTFAKDLSKYFTVFLVFLSSPENIGQFLLFEVIRHFITRLIVRNYNSNVYLISLVSLTLQYFTFYQFGGTNSIATIDLANAYHGISENYNIYVVGLLMALANLAPSVYWAIYPWTILYSTNRRTRASQFLKSKLPILFFYCIIGCCLMSACVVLRYHLFIWSVFSPKLCYYAGWNSFMSFIVGWIFEGFFFLS